MVASVLQMACEDKASREQKPPTRDKGNYSLDYDSAYMQIKAISEMTQLKIDEISCHLGGALIDRVIGSDPCFLKSSKKRSMFPINGGINFTSGFSDNGEYSPYLKGYKDTEACSEFKLDDDSIDWNSYEIFQTWYQLSFRQALLHIENGRCNITFKN